MNLSEMFKYMGYCHGEIRVMQGRYGGGWLACGCALIEWGFDEQWSDLVGGDNDYFKARDFFNDNRETCLIEGAESPEYAFSLCATGIAKMCEAEIEGRKSNNSTIERAAQLIDDDFANALKATDIFAHAFSSASSKLSEKNESVHGVDIELICNAAISTAYATMGDVTTILDNAINVFLADGLRDKVRAECVNWFESNNPEALVLNQAGGMR